MRSYVSLNTTVLYCTAASILYTIPVRRHALIGLVGFSYKLMSKSSPCVVTRPTKHPPVGKQTMYSPYFTKERKR